MKSIWQLDIKDLVTPGVRKVQQAVKEAFATMEGAEKQLEQVINKTTAGLEKQAGAARNAINGAPTQKGANNGNGGILANWGLTGGVAIAAVAAAGYEVMNLGRQVFETGRQFETLDNVINYTSGSAAEATKNHQFLNRIIKDYKLPVVETTQAYSDFSAALMGSSLQGEKARKIFEGVSTAVIAMHLPAQQTSQVFNALQQMISKGTVQSQELKLQLGNALPGALSVAAKSMNMTMQQFTNAVEQGNIKAEEFLPRFAEALQQQYAGAIPNAIQSTQAKLNELNNTFIELQNTIFKTFEENTKTIIDFSNQSLQALSSVYNAFTGTGDITNAGYGAIMYFRELRKVVDDIAVSYTNMWNDIKPLLAELGGELLKAAASVIMGLSQAFNALGKAAIALKVPFMIATAPLRLVLEILKAFNWTVEQLIKLFDAVYPKIVAFGEVIKKVFTNVGDTIGNALKGSAKLIGGIFSGDLDMIKAGLKDIGNSANTISNTYNTAYGKAAAKQFNDKAALPTGLAGPQGPGAYAYSGPIIGTRNVNGQAAAPNTPPFSPTTNGDTTDAGGKNKNLIINIRNLVNELNFNKYEEDAGTMKTKILEALLEVINDLNPSVNL